MARHALRQPAPAAALTAPRDSRVDPMEGPLAALALVLAVLLFGALVTAMALL